MIHQPDRQTGLGINQSDPISVLKIKISLHFHIPPLRSDNSVKLVESRLHI